MTSASPGNSKRLPASTFSSSMTNVSANAAATAATSSAPSASAESVQTLIEAIVELRPFFPAALPSGGSGGNGGSSSTANLTSLPSGSPLTASSGNLEQSPSFHSLLTRPASNGSLGLGSYVDLMSLSSFASPTACNGGGGGAVTNGSFNFGVAASASTSRYGEWLHTASSPRGAGPMGGGNGLGFSPSVAYAVGGSSVSGGGAGGAGAAAGQGGAGVVPATPHGTVEGASASLLMHPSGGWICRAMAFNEKEVSHANGAISVNQSLTSKCALINEVAKGKIMARILSSYQDVQERYGLSHVELAVDNQYVSRSDLFLISEALRERILYEGEEIHVCSFRIRVREMLQAVVNAFAPTSNNNNNNNNSSPAIPISTPTTGGYGGSGAGAAAGAAGGGGTSNAAAANTPAAAAAMSFVRVGCGIVLPTTRINFQSLSPVHYIVVELSREMWDTTMDGRIALTWAIRKFISELLLKQLPKRKASPLIRVVFTGRLRKEFQFGRHSDVFHLLELPREARNIDVVEEIRMHCEALVERVLREVQATAYRQLEAEVAAYYEGRAVGRGGAVWELYKGEDCGGRGLVENDGGVNSSPKGRPTSPTATLVDHDGVFEAYVRRRQSCIDGITAKRLFVHAKQSNTLEALSVLLERCNHHYVDRHLTLCGHAITVVSAGKGFYQVTNSLMQIVCARLHDMGLDKVHVVCIGRPPLHVTPLLEYTSDDDSLRSQYHLHSRVLSSTGGPRRGVGAAAEVERYYESPEWMDVFFFHPAFGSTGGETVFELLPKECWQREHPTVSTVDTMWPPQELSSSIIQALSQQQQQQPHALPSLAAGAAAGGAVELTSVTARAAQSYETGAADGCVNDVSAAQRLTAAATNPPLLVPGLGLRFYPVSEVTLPVPSATAACTDLFVGEWGGMSAACMDEGNSMYTKRAQLPDVLGMPATASHSGTDAITSPLSPFSHHTQFGLRRMATGSGGDRASPLCAAGDAASSPLLVRTTTASSSVFASPNVPGRGSMPRAGAAWRESHHNSHGLQHGLHGASPLHPPLSGAFPPLQPQPHQRLSGSVPAAAAAAAVGGGCSGGFHRSMAGLAGSAQRRVRGGGGAVGASRTPQYTSSSSIAVSVIGPGEGSRHSHPNSLASYSASSHAPLHMSRSFDYKTTANPALHSLGAFERSVRSAGSSFISRHHAPTPSHAQPRSLLYRESSPVRSSPNSVTAHPAAAVAAASAPLEEDGVSGPVVVCSWYCLHAAKLHQEGGSGTTPSGAALARAFPLNVDSVAAGFAEACPGEEGIWGSAAVATATVTDAVVSLPAVLPIAKPWHKALSRTRADAVFCGCNVVDSDLRNGYLILEITLDAAVLPSCFWSPRVILDDQGWNDLMSCFTGRDDRLAFDADSDLSSEDAMADEDSIIGGGGSSSSADSACKNAERGGRSTAGEVYRFQSDFRAADVFCRSHSGISVDGRTLILPTHNNSVHFQSSEEILLRLQPGLFAAAADEGGDATLERRWPVSPTSSHWVRGREGDGVEEKKEATQREASVVDLRESRQAPHRAGSNAAASAADATAAPTPPLLPPAEAAGQDAVGRTAVVGKGGGDSGARWGSPNAVASSSSSTTPHGSGNRAAPPENEGADARQSAAPPATTHDTYTPKLDGGTPHRAKAEARDVGDSELTQAAEMASAATTATAASVRPVPLRLPPAPTAAHPVVPSVQATDAYHDHRELAGGQGEGAVAGTRGTTATSCVAGTVVTVGFVQLRNSLLFAIKPINPLRHSAEEEQREDAAAALSQSAESASTATVLRRRWQWRHPNIASEPPQLASWTRLCTCHLLPLYGSKPAYPREGFYTVSPHQYTVVNPSAAGGHAEFADEKKRLLEFVLQRLQQQYQIVVDAPGLAAGAQWPRADPSPNARLEMSLGHQTHTLKVGETAKTISITRMLHRGMYSNGQVTHMLSYRYLLWNYLADEFATREVHMEAQVGERNAFRWESLDRWLQERPEAYIPRGPDLWLRSREVAVMLLPEDPAHPPSFEEFYRFIGYRFSVHLSTHGKVEWQPHSSGITLDVPDATPFAFPPAPALMDVVLVHDNPLTLDTRNVMDRVTGRTIAFEVPVEERYMSVDVSLPKQYDPHCCYFLKVSWLVCAAPLVVDWFGSFIANASRFHFHAVPMACYYNSPKAESLTPHYDVAAVSTEEEPALRRALVELLISPTYRYYPDTPTITRNCRLVHLTGLCCVILPPSATMVAQWYQNACLRQGSVEQLELLVHFKEAEALARRRAAVSLKSRHA